MQEIKSGYLVKYCKKEFGKSVIEYLHEDYEIICSTDKLIKMLKRENFGQIWYVKFLIDVDAYAKNNNLDIDKIGF
ncbi:MAG: hypothetical protein RR088_03805 [Clostridia bacterium]